MQFGRQLTTQAILSVLCVFRERIKAEMVDLEYKTKMMVSRQMSGNTNSTLHVSIPEATPFKPITNASPVAASDSACSDYEQYLRLPELSSRWAARDFPAWRYEPLLRPALIGLEFTFRLISTVLSDGRSYVNVDKWGRRLETLAATQIRVISLVVEAEAADTETRGTAPIVDLMSSGGMVPARVGSHAEVWMATGEVATVVNRASEESLLPRLAAWRKSEDVARRIMFSIECYMGRCPYTLGLGEPNLTGKPNLNYDAVCCPAQLSSLKRSPSESEKLNNMENQVVYSIHQILECWIQAGREILTHFVINNIDKKRFREAADGCYILEQIWKLLLDVEDLLLSSDPDDFLRLKAQLLASPSDSAPFCFRSRGLVELTKSCKDLKQKVPGILEVEVDPKGGPRVQEAAMKLYGGRKEGEETEKIEVLQGLQSLEKAVKGFYYGYKQVMVVAIGSLEANGKKALTVAGSESGAGDSLAQMFLEPTYFPSLDAAKTFVGDSWTKEYGGKRWRRNQESS